MDILVFKIFSRVPVSTELAINFQLKTAEFEMLLNAVKASNLLPAAEALNDKPMAFDFNVFF
jgi:hypothetical protein